MRDDAWHDPHPDPDPPAIEAFPDLDPAGATIDAFAMPPWEPYCHREIAAFHEAGHAVVGLVLMGVPDAGHARVNEDSSGQVSFGPIERDRPPPRPSPAAALSVAAILAAGFQCELLFMGRHATGVLTPRDHRSTDYPRARTLLANHDLPGAGWLWIAEGIARHVLTTHWAAVWLIGHHLSGRGELSGAELRRLYSRSTHKGADLKSDPLMRTTSARKGGT
ncbi:hypothetical protein [uncultured Thiocystis sp.]|jgi:hypothetical protein|uniref:hypothetical protein n=1 Tax=uncultured Thiocystis sp. TaxID=1202134 RepID=UPI0025ED2D95|nr:hypothetical protein [uncultured Thiocystis sp.]